MKKRILLAVISFVFIGATAFVVLNKKNQTSAALEKKYSLLPRKEALSYAREWEITNSNAAVLGKKIEANPSDKKSMLTLAGIYLQEARATGNYSYYNEAAMQLINKVLANDAENFEALTFKTTILLSKHHFEEAVKLAEQLKQKYPYYAYVYSLLVDANVELGNYAAAIEAADKMISIRPDIRSYSRIAYLREIYGDIPGAIDAMKMAVDAGLPGDENTEWCRIQTGKLYEQWGKWKEAEMQYTIALNNRENYPYALAGLAGIAVENKDYKKALSLFQQANSIISDHTFREGIAEVYEFTGQKEKAAAMANEVLAFMKEHAKSGNENHEMAHAYMGVKDFAKALEYAMKEYNRRPGNIEVNETMAMVYAGLEDYKSALLFIEKALRTNNKKPALLELAALIKEKSKTN